MEFSQKDIDRFWSKVDKSGECWLFHGRNHNSIMINGKIIPSRKLSLKLTNGYWYDKALWVTCGNEACVNPCHMKKTKPLMPTRLIALNERNEGLYLADEQVRGFWNNVKVVDDKCWPWVGQRNTQGYGHYYAGKKCLKAHRVAYQLTKGDIVKGTIRHSCDFTSCCNPSHLIDGTRKDNSQDMVLKGRHNNQKKRNCPCGLPFTLNPKSNQRICRPCASKASARSHAANKLFKASNYIFAQYNPSQPT